MCVTRGGVCRGAGELEGGAAAGCAARRSLSRTVRTDERENPIEAGVQMVDPYACGRTESPRWIVSCREHKLPPPVMTLRRAVAEGEVPSAPARHGPRVQLVDVEAWMESKRAKQ